MITFTDWAAHYDYDPATDEAREDYAEYRRMADVIAAIMDRPL